MFFFQDHHHNLFQRTTSCDVGQDVVDATSAPSFISRKDGHPSNMHRFAPPVLRHDGFEDLLLEPHLALANACNAGLTQPAQPPPEPSTRKVPCSPVAPPAAATMKPASKAPPVARKSRPNRKDRHSKIVTAQGTRGRRMRLSLDVAKKFFDLQDALGLDKPSKTVEWLLTKSAKAIKAITTYSRSQTHGYSSGSAKVESSTSGCEVNSRNIIDSTNNINIAVDTKEAAPAPKRTASPNARRSASTPLLSSKAAGDASDPSPARKSRSNARARARERTEMKRTTIGNNDHHQEGNTISKQLESSSWAVGTTTLLCEPEPKSTLAAAGGGDHSLPPLVDTGESSVVATPMFHYSHHTIADACDIFNFFHDNCNMFFGDQMYQQ